MLDDPVKTMEAPAGIMAKLLPSDSANLRLLRLLNDGASETRLVGGCVRNALLGLPVTDIDLATTLRPDAVIERATSAGLKCVPTGIDHGTVTIVLDGRTYEVTTLRQDVETDGRHALVSFGTDFAADAMRRDFTINALSLSIDGTLHDYTGGLADLEARIVRFIGNAETRIREDYLRILRFFRFTAGYGERLEDTGLRACISLKDGLGQLSRERIAQEMRKLLVIDGVYQVLAAMSGTGIAKALLGVDIVWASLLKLSAFEVRIGMQPDFVRRLASLFPDIGERVEHLRETLRLSNEERDRLETIARGNDVGDLLRFKCFAYRHGMNAAFDVLHYQAAMHADRMASLAEIGFALKAWSVPANPFRAAEFMALGVQRGPELGAAIERAQMVWCDLDFPHDPARLDQIRAVVVGRQQASR